MLERLQAREGEASVLERQLPENKKERKTQTKGKRFGKMEGGSKSQG
jgi:hypothetical protein